MARAKELMSQYYQGQNEGRIVSNKGEGYEKATAKHGDHFFLKFKKLSKWPHQLIRYVIKDHVLYYYLTLDIKEEVTHYWLLVITCLHQSIVSSVEVNVNLNYN